MFSPISYEAFTDELLKIAGLTTEEAQAFKKAIREQARFERMSRDGKMSDVDKAAHRDNTERIKQYTSKRRGDASDLPGWAKDPKGKQPEANTRRAAPPPRDPPPGRSSYGGSPRPPPGGQASSAGGAGRHREGWPRSRAHGERYGKSGGPPPGRAPRPGTGPGDPFGGDSVDDWIKKQRQKWADDDVKWKADRAASDKKWSDTKAKWKADDAKWQDDFNKRWPPSGGGGSPSPSGGGGSWADDIGKSTPRPSAARGLKQYAVPIGIGAAGLAGLGAYAYWKNRQAKPPPVAEARL